ALTVVSIPEFKLTTTLRGYGDELRGPLLGSTMQQENSYLKYLIGENGKEFANWGNPTWLSWDSKHAGTQADYVLGNNAMELSNLIGYGNKYPEYVHHRGASIPANAKTVCKGFKWLESTELNPNVAVGALVGGPFLNESYIDSRNNSMQGVPTTYNSDVIVGLLSSLVTTSSVGRSFT
ncbi:hypothetical protein IFM89_020442, partial [Coptis chinensis]